ncbi:hypothetical protein BOTCAL_0063g00090 [Botryotinia calthae]|uniref:Uncharacterized protein n=1 Tax=Botryotinia calthae TaxID=38488 RepID=A0A4Y8D9R7_9HELO|nr:hypothetical protein BOTCAL_0063g00090 [Botryotinia calthae]
MDIMSTTHELRQWEGQRKAGAGAGTKVQSRIQHDDGVAYGVFKFLNPTTRREMINWEEGAKESSRGGENSENSVMGEEEKKVEFESIPAPKEKRGNGEEKELVARKWRSRDNRKDMHFLTVTLHIIQNAYLVSSNHHCPNN